MDEHLHAPDPTVAAGHLAEVADATPLPGSSPTAPGGSTTPARWPGSQRHAHCGRHLRHRGARPALPRCRWTGRPAGAPVRYAVNTHEQGHIAYGNSLLPEEAVLIGHEAMRRQPAPRPSARPRRRPLGAVGDWGGVTRGVPDVTVPLPRCEYMPASGRSTSSIPAVRRTRPATSSSGCPTIVCSSPVTCSSWASPRSCSEDKLNDAGAVLDWLAGFGPERVVTRPRPGGWWRQTCRRAGRARALLPVRPRAGRRGQARGDRTAALGAAGRSRPVRRVAGPERLVLNLHRAYADADGVPLDLAVALDDAMSLNGGPLTTHVCCLA